MHIKINFVFQYFTKIGKTKKYHGQGYILPEYFKVFSAFRHYFVLHYFNII